MTLPVFPKTLADWTLVREGEEWPEDTIYVADEDELKNGWELRFHTEPESSVCTSISVIYQSPKATTDFSVSVGSPLGDSSVEEMLARLRKVCIDGGLASDG